MIISEGNKKCKQCKVLVGVSQLRSGLCIECVLDNLDRESGVVTRYYLTIHPNPEQEVTMEKFVWMERACGFHNSNGRPDRPATAGFSSSRAGRDIDGTVVRFIPPPGLTPTTD